MTIQFDEDPSEDAVDAVEMPLTANGRATATLGITIVEQGRQAWPKFELSDEPFPGEDASELITRVNDYALKGLYDIAEQGRALLKQVIQEEKSERNSK